MLWVLHLRKTISCLKLGKKEILFNPKHLLKLLQKSQGLNSSRQNGKQQKSCWKNRYECIEMF